MSNIFHSPEHIANTFAIEKDGSIYWKVPGRGRRMKNPVGSKNQGYLRINIDGRSYYNHQLAWCLYYGAWAEGEIDHINGDRSDNRKENLRAHTDRAVSCRNKSIQRNNNTGYTGVSLIPSTGKYRSYIKVNSKQIRLGHYATAEEARDARERWVSRRPELGFTERHGL